MNPRSIRPRALGSSIVIASYAFVALLLLLVIPDRFAASAWFGGLIWVMVLGETLVYVWRRRGRFRAFLAHRDRCVGCGARLLHSMLHEGLSYQCGSCHLIQPWAASWDRQESIQRFTSFYTDEVFKNATGKTRQEFLVVMDRRGASRGHAAAVEAVHGGIGPHEAHAFAICYELDRGSDRWFDLETPMFEPTLFGMLVRAGVLIAIPAGLLGWRLLLSS